MCESALIPLIDNITAPPPPTRGRKLRAKSDNKMGEEIEASYFVLEPLAIWKEIVFLLGDIRHSIT